MKNSVRRGPAPVEPGVHLAPERSRVLEAVVAHGPATVSALAERLGVHANSVRPHLDALVDRGHVRRAVRPAVGRGRPAGEFEATPAGRAALAQPEESPLAGGLLPALVDHLVARSDGAEQARALGESWGRRALGARPSARVVGDLLARQGFAPEERDGDLVLRTCPLLAEATAHPEIVCQLHAGLVARAGVLEPFSEADGCRVRLGRVSGSGA